MGCGTLIGLGLGGIGAGVSASAAQSERDAANQATQDQLWAQQKFAKQGMDVFNQSLAKSTPEAVQQQLGQGQQQFLQASKNAALTPLNLPSNAAPTTADNISYQGQQAKNTLGQQANANLQGYSNIGLQQYLKDLQANSQLGAIGTEASRSASLFPYILQGAAQSKQGEASLGQLLGVAGSLVGLGSGSGLFSGAPASAVSTANPFFTLGSQGAQQAAWYGLPAWAQFTGATGLPGAYP